MPNTSPLITKASLESSIANRLAVFKEHPEHARCKGSRSGFLNILAKQSHEEFKRWVDDFLSVPCKPLMNPCL